MVVVVTMLVFTLLAGVFPAHYQSYQPISGLNSWAPLLRKERFNVLGAKCPAPFATYRHPSDCSVFYRCFAYQRFKDRCPGGLFFHEHLQVCDYPYRVDCDISKTRELAI